AYRIAAAALAVAALVVFALTRSDSPSRQPAATAPTPIVAPTPSARQSDTKVNVVCRLGAPVANDISAAIRHYFPHITIRNLGAYRCVRGSGASGRILFEAITGSYGGLNIDVETTLRGAGPGVNTGPQLGNDNRHNVLLARTEAIAVGLQVDVVAYGRAGRRPPVDAMRALGDFISLNVIL
ncbi:MAG: hypothetical protein ACRDVG_05330, partial [Jatrophihabitantaceae bacterium]